MNSRTDKILFETIVIVSYKDIDEPMLNKCSMIADSDETNKILHQRFKVVVGLWWFPRIMTIPGSAKLREEYVS